MSEWVTHGPTHAPGTLLRHASLIMVALCNRADHYIFALLFVSSIYLFFLA